VGGFAKGVADVAGIEAVQVPGVVPVVTSERIVAVAAVDARAGVLGTVDIDGVIAGAAADHIHTAISDDGVVGAVAVDVVIAVTAVDVLDVGDTVGDRGCRADVDAVGQSDVDAGSAETAGRIDVLRVVERVGAAKSVDVAGDAAGGADLEDVVAAAAPQVSHVL